MLPEEVIASYEAIAKGKQLDSSTDRFLSYTTYYQTNTLHLSTKEASEAGLVGTFMLVVRAEMHNMYPT